MTTRTTIQAAIEAKDREIRSIEAHMSTMSTSQMDWACEQINKLAAEIEALELELTKL